jgi:thymidylate synthase (FAD)
MKHVDAPKVFLIAKTMLHESGLKDYLASVGITEADWFADPRVSDAENLIEAGGRMCYRSWAPWDPNKPEGTNPNVTKVREGNTKYIANVVKSEHGALLEHANVTMIFKDVSRVFTHELVRHRAGWGYSQESLRYVRLDGDIRFWIPDLAKQYPGVPELMEETVDYLSRQQAKLHTLCKIDEVQNFSLKKLLTSMFRRIAPIGLATSIMATGNLRAWRHVIRMRTETVAEEEIRICFRQAARILKDLYPNVFFDMIENEAGEWVPEYRKI